MTSINRTKKKWVLYVWKLGYRSPDSIHTMHELHPGNREFAVTKFHGTHKYIAICEPESLNHSWCITLQYYFQYTHTQKKKNPLNALKRKVMYLLANQNEMAQGVGVGGNKAVWNGRSHNLEEFKVTFRFLSVPRKLYFINNFLVQVPVGQPQLFVTSHLYY